MAVRETEQGRLFAGVAAHEIFMRRAEELTLGRRVPGPVAAQVDEAIPWPHVLVHATVLSEGHGTGTSLARMCVSAEG